MDAVAAPVPFGNWISCHWSATERRPAPTPAIINHHPTRRSVRHDPSPAPRLGPCLAPDQQDLQGGGFVEIHTPDESYVIRNRSQRQTVDLPDFARSMAWAGISRALPSTPNKPPLPGGEYQMTSVHQTSAHRVANDRERSLLNPKNAVRTFEKKGEEFASSTAHLRSRRSCKMETRW